MTAGKEEETMSATNDVGIQRAQAAPSGTPDEQTYVPDVDVWETAKGLHLTVGLPGVAREAVELTTENDTLTISGKVGVDAPAGYRLVAQEFPMGQYRRAFELSPQVDPAGTTARLKDGILQIKLPNAAARRRRIEIVA
jgi:HSP20 family molecular chaperone IbpA